MREYCHRKRLQALFDVRKSIIKRQVTKSQNGMNVRRTKLINRLQLERASLKSNVIEAWELLARRSEELSIYKEELALFKERCSVSKGELADLKQEKIKLLRELIDVKTRLLGVIQALVDVYNNKVQGLLDSLAVGVNVTQHEQTDTGC